VPVFRPESEPTFRSFTVLVEDQKEVYLGLRRAGVEVVLHYAPPVYRQPVYPDGLRGADRLPITDRLAERLVCLPVTPELTDEDTAYVADALRAIVAGAV
jgi:UDP-2-acetamido-2-deoxy-ribo-hexuluronate aminotransferase